MLLCFLKYSTVCCAVVFFHPSHHLPPRLPGWSNGHRSAVVTTLRSTCDRCLTHQNERKEKKRFPIRKIIVYGTLLMGLFCSAPMTRSQSGIHLRWMLLERRTKAKDKRRPCILLPKKVESAKCDRVCGKKKNV